MNWTARIVGMLILACCCDAVAGPAIRGAVYRDANSDGITTPEEALAGVVLQLYRDNGNGVWDTSDSLEFPVLNTDSNGEYRFDSLDPNGDYFVVQPEQSSGGVFLARNVSGLQRPGYPNLVIDTFLTEQNLVADPVTSVVGSMVDGSATDILGTQRDMYLELRDGTAEIRLRSKPFSLNSGMNYDTSAAVSGMAVVTWDGSDDSAGIVPALGLAGIDLTQGGLNSDIMLRLGVDAAGAGEMLTLRMYADDSSTFSETQVEIPTTGGLATAFVLVPFSSFTGPVDATHVDAIQVILDSAAPSIDAQLGMIGAFGPVIHDITNIVTSVPEPSFWALISIALALLLCLHRRQQQRL